MFSTTWATVASLSELSRTGDRNTMLARSPSVGGISSRAIGFPGLMFVTSGVSPAGCLGPSPYHPSPKGTNISPLHFFWPVASYQFVLKPLTNSSNQDPAPL